VEPRLAFLRRSGYIATAMLIQQQGSTASPGEQLRSIRERLGLTIRTVESASSKIAAKYKNPDYLISLSRLSDIETKGIIPNIYRMYSLAVIYRTDIRDVMRVFGVDLGNVVDDLELADVPLTHLSSAVSALREVEVPVEMDPGFDLRMTSPIPRMISRWGSAPLPYLKKFLDRTYNYGYIGSEDWTMYPLLMPGSFVQVDESKRKVTEGPWRSEFERPIYFVETRSGYTCCWCEINGQMLVLKPHPLSPAKTRVLRYDSEAEIFGQVVGVAMRLDGWLSRRSDPEE
jgi:transcriptional regulator with XRE-family HTH domain